MKKIVLIAVVLGILFAGQQTSAHVLITDETKSKGAILHIIPDDDPVAGQEATLFFDTQDQLLKNNPGSKVTLTIEDTNGAKIPLATKTDGSLVTANYTFTIQGIYKLAYTVQTSDGTYVFAQSQRVSRGVVGSALDKPLHPWAEILTITAGTGLIVLLILAFNRRRDISEQSKLQ